MARAFCSWNWSFEFSMPLFTPWVIWVFTISSCALSSRAGPLPCVLFVLREIRHIHLCCKGSFLHLIQFCEHNRDGHLRGGGRCSSCPDHFERFVLVAEVRVHDEELRPLRTVLRHLWEDRGELIEGLLVRSGVIGLFLHDHVEHAVLIAWNCSFDTCTIFAFSWSSVIWKHHVGVEEVLDVRGHKVRLHFAGTPQVVENIDLGEVVWHLLRLDTRPTAHLTLGAR